VGFGVKHRKGKCREKKQEKVEKENGNSEKSENVKFE
jgi:hypothetical protein